MAVSVTESAEQARTFLTLLLAELYLQLTTISWLSVNSQVDRVLTVYTLVSLYPQVQRHSAPSRQGADGSSWWEAAWAMLPSSPSTSLYTYTSSTVEEVNSTLHIIYTIKCGSQEGVVEAVSRAEARVRVAEEMAVNNSRARARLAATQVLRWVE